MHMFHAPQNLNLPQRTAHGTLPEGNDARLDHDEDGSQRGGVRVDGGKVGRGIGIWRNSWHRNIPGVEYSICKGLEMRAQDQRADICQYLTVAVA